MDNNTQQGDFESVKHDVQQLLADVGSWIQTASAHMRERWEETKPVLEAKLAAAEAEVKRIGTASAGAAGEMGSGFMSAFSELKKAFADARAHFRRPLAEGEAAGEQEEDDDYEALAESEESDDVN